MRSIRRLSGLTFFLLSGCNEPLSAPIPTAHPELDAPVRGGVLHLATTFDLKSLDPATSASALDAELLEMIYAGLVDFDASGKIFADLSENYSISGDARTYAFRLRRGVLMHDGEELTASDVKRSIERALHPETPSPFASFYDRIEGFQDYTEKKSEHLAGVRSTGRYDVEIRLREPDATFLAALAMPSLRPVCKSAGERFDDAWSPCGAGPFKLAPGGWQPSRSVSLVRHEGYFRTNEPYLDGVVYTLGMNAVTQRFKLEAGEIDVFRELTQLDTTRFSADPKWREFGFRETARNLLGEGMNVEMPPFDNVEVRRAVAAAIDRDELRRLRGTNLVIQTRVLPGVLGRDPGFVGQRFDRAAALEHMRLAGWPFDPATGTGGWPTPITYVVTQSGLSEFTAQVIQQQLAKIGLRIELKLVSFPTYLALTQRRHSVAISNQGWNQDFPDPADFFEPLFSTSAINEESSNNTSFYSNDRLDALLARGRRAADPRERQRLYDDADRIVVDDAPWALTLSYPLYVVHQPYLRRYRDHAVYGNFIGGTWLDRGATAVAKRAGVLGSVLGGLR